MNVIYLTEEEFQNSKARMAETDKIDGYLKLIQPLYEAVRKFQPDALLLYCVSRLPLLLPASCRAYP